jgi:hypothetical protein
MIRVDPNQTATWPMSVDTSSETGPRRRLPVAQHKVVQSPWQSVLDIETFPSAVSWPGLPRPPRLLWRCASKFGVAGNRPETALNVAIWIRKITRQLFCWFQKLRVIGVLTSLWWWLIELP